MTPRRPPQSSFPASEAQQHLYAHLKLRPEVALAYQFSACLHFDGPLDADALERALARVVARHEALRTGFVEQGGVLCRTLAPDARVTLERVDAGATGDADGLARRHLAELAGSPLELGAAPLLRARLLRLGPVRHGLCVCVHHLVWDAWSWWVFVRDLAAFYNEQTGGSSAGLPVLSEESEAAQGTSSAEAARAAARAYWRQQLAAPLPLTQVLPTLPRPARQLQPAGFVRAAPRAELGHAVQRLALRTRSSPFIVMLAAFKVLLARYTGQADLLVGAPLHGRSEWARDRVGYFVEVAALRTRLEQAVTFRAVVEQVREAVLAAREHGQGPSTPFRIMFMFRDVSLRGDEFQGLRVSLEEASKPAAKFELTLALQPTPAGYAAELEYDAQLYDPGFAAQLLRHYLRLLEAALAAPDAPLTTLTPLEPEEQLGLLRRWNETTQPSPAATLEQLAARSASRFPRRTAFQHGERRVDFAWLEAQANRLAHRLRAAGVSRGVRVGIAVGRSPELGVGALAALKLGAAYVALDPSYPRARLLSIVEDADLAAVVTSRLHEPLVAAFGVPTVVLEEQGSAEELPAVTPPNGARPEDVAYLIYTSGSTGGPKGVLGLHRGMANRIAWMPQRHPVTEEDVFCLKTSPHFVDSITELFTPLVAGAPAIILDDATVQSPARLLAALAEQRVTRLILVPSLLRVMLDTLEAGGPRPERLRYLVSSGEALRADLARRCLRLLPGCTLINLYGTSEASADSTFHEVMDPEDEALEGVTVPIGKPIANTRVYILDGQRHPCPEGVPGELFLAGEGLAAGYHAKPGLTSERFVELVFPDGTRERAYRTGDIGRRRADGAIEYLGRNDQQVKVRGQRVELSEVDTWLEQHPAVREAITLAEPSASGEPVLASFAVASGAVPRGEEVLQFLAERLPAAMVPARIAWVQEIPRLPNGKVDRQQLRAASPAPAEPPRAQQPPASDGQHFIAALWRSLLGVDSIDTRDTLFGLGGHSLLAMQFAAEVERQKGVRLDPNHALTRSLEFLAARIDRERIDS